jgi:hypothetical protein
LLQSPGPTTTPSMQAPKMIVSVGSGATVRWPEVQVLGARGQLHVPENGTVVVVKTGHSGPCGAGARLVG